MTLTLQKQPTPSTCAQTCLAMALDVPVADVVVIYGTQGMGTRDLLRALDECRILHNVFVFPTFLVTGWHFAVVPSLNNRGGNHQILIFFDADTGCLTVLDPSRAQTYATDGRDLLSWQELILFHPGGRLKGMK